MTEREPAISLSGLLIARQREERDQALVTDYESGLSALTVACRHETSAPQVFRALKRAGIPARSFRARPPNTRNAAIVAAYRAGSPAAEVARSVGLTKERVRQILMRACGSYQRPPRRHRCTDACAAVLAAGVPALVAMDLARATGVSWLRICRAAKWHGVTLGGPRHVCGPRCAAVLAALHAHAPLRRVVPTSMAARLKSYHPDWPWFDGRKRLRLATRGE